jgi:hypothetical protein
MGIASRQRGGIRFTMRGEVLRAGKAGGQGGRARADSTSAASRIPGDPRVRQAGDHESRGQRPALA